LENIYFFAYLGTSTVGWGNYGKYYDKLVLEISDSTLFKYDFKTGKNLFCYAVNLPRSQATVERVMDIMQRDLKNTLGTTFAFLGYEIYLKAGRNVPSRKHYGDTPQIEDGVGMVRGFDNQFDSLMRALERQPVSNARSSGRALRGSVMTGTLFAPVLRKMIERMNQQVGTRLEVVAVENDYFGGDVSVAGLLTGGDFLAARERVRGEFAIIPKVALKSDEPIMLDGMSFAELQGQFSVPIYALDFPAFAGMVKHGFTPKAQARISEAA